MRVHGRGLITAVDGLGLGKGRRWVSVGCESYLQLFKNDC